MATLSQCATRCDLPTVLGAPNTMSMNRSVHTAMDSLGTIALVYPNFYILQASGEPNNGSQANIRASVEYPEGVFTQITFKGSATGAIPVGGLIQSDTVSVNIPKGATFWVRTWFYNPAGMFYNDYGTVDFGGDAMQYGTALADLTMGGTVTHQNVSLKISYKPAAILSNTDVNSVFLFGDSKVHGTNDVIDSGRGTRGELARAFEKAVPYIWHGVSSLTLNQVVNTANYFNNRKALMNYCSAIICNLGINDISASRTPAQILADINTFKSFAPGLPMYWCTLAPHSTSTDSWATTANQTPSSLQTNRVATNLNIRSLKNIDGYLEIADIVESARDSGIWKAAWTNDGVHEMPVAYKAIESSLTIPWALL